MSALAADDRPGAEEQLGRALEDSSAGVRAVAARALARRGAWGWTDRVAQLLSDPDEQVRDGARSALDTWAAMAGCGPRFAAIRTKASKEVRAGLVPALAACAEPEARAAWGESLADADPSVRAGADRSLRLASGEVAGKAIAACLDATGDAERIACAGFAKEQKLTGALPRLAALAAYEVGVSEVRTAARAAVTAMLDDVDAPSLAEKARDAKDRSERAEALQLLALVPGERTYVALTHGLGDADEYVRQVAASCLGEFGNLRAVGPLAKAGREASNTRIHKTIQRALDRLTKPRKER